MQFLPFPPSFLLGRASAHSTRGRRSICLPRRDGLGASAVRQTSPPRGVSSRRTCPGFRRPGSHSRDCLPPLPLGRPMLSLDSFPPIVVHRISPKTIVANTPFSRVLDRRVRCQRRPGSESLLTGGELPRKLKNMSYHPGATRGPSKVPKPSKAAPPYLPAAPLPDPPFPTTTLEVGSELNIR